MVIFHSYVSLPEGIFMDVTSSKSTKSGVVMGISWDILSGRWLSHPSEKYEFVSWGYYSQYMESHNPFMF